MKNYFFYLILFSAVCLFAQDKKVETPFAAVDSLYREDQFFLGITYNTLIKKPVGFKQDGVSIGINAGFLRDIPLNKSRTVAIAIGVGATYNKYHQNLRVSRPDNSAIYQLIGDQPYDRNKLEQVMLNLPFEFRWRTSTPEKYDFFRVYTGFKMSYLIYNKTLYVGDDGIENVQNNSDFNKFQYGPTISLGYNTWNLHAFYGINPIFSGAILNGEEIQMRNLNLGLIFYIL